MSMLIYGVESDGLKRMQFPNKRVGIDGLNAIIKLVLYPTKMGN